MKSKPVWKEVCAECNRIPREKIQARIVQLEKDAKEIIKNHGLSVDLGIVYYERIDELKKLLEVEG